MALGRPKAELKLSEEERETLKKWLRRGSGAQQLALRARIILLCEERTNGEVAEELGVSLPTVGKWRSRFVLERLAGLSDAPRPGGPRKYGDDEVARLIRQTLSSKPKGATNWSTRLLAKRTGVGRDTISRIWRAFGLKPHLQENFKLSTDPFFVEKVRDIVGLYMNPPERAIVLCIDEKSQIQALDRSQPMLPMLPGQAERRTYDYLRHGTTSLFAALDVQTGKVIGQCHQRHRQQEFLRFMKYLDSVLPKRKGYSFHIVLDNYGTHKTAAVKKWFLAHPDYVLHFTPTGASWINQVERFFAALTQRQIRRGVFSSVNELKSKIMEYLDAHNSNPKPFVWTADADAILEKLKFSCKRIRRTGH